VRQQAKKPEPDPAQAARVLRINLKILRDLASAEIVGGATVMLTLLLTNISVHTDTFVALEITYMHLATSSDAFGKQVLKQQARTTNKWWRLLRDGPLVAIIAVGVFVGTGDWPVKASSLAWWIIVALAFFVLVVGAIQRQAAEYRLDELAADQVLRADTASQAPRT
jgi:uncharacterized membrane protein